MQTSKINDAKSRGLVWVLTVMTPASGGVEAIRVVLDYVTFLLDQLTEVIDSILLPCQAERSATCR